jgi:hypothetical protein
MRKAFSPCPDRACFEERCVAQFASHCGTCDWHRYIRRLDSFPIKKSIFPMRGGRLRALACWVARYSALSSTLLHCPSTQLFLDMLR